MSVHTSVRTRSTSFAVASGSAAADRRAVLDGVRAMLPLLLGVAPFGLVIGVTVAELGVPHLAGWSLGWLVYAGSAQLAAVGLLAGSASAGAVVATVAVINLRLAVYSAAMAPHWRGTSKAWRLVAAYLLIDPSFAVGNALQAPGTPVAVRLRDGKVASTVAVGGPEVLDLLAAVRVIG